MIDRLFPNVTKTPGDFEQLYPLRPLRHGAMVTRFGPSPTGFMHLGGMYAALISNRLARQTGGVFYLRIEDTDRRREVVGAAELIVKSMSSFGIVLDEGEFEPGQERGDYGPYRQSGRADIYQAYVRLLVEQGKAYPCFATSEELEYITKQQEMLKVRTGYYGHWAIWRDRSEAEIMEALDAGKSFVIRFRSPGMQSGRVSFTDSIRGVMEFPENDVDVVIQKSDGLPTYHFAHAVDDHLMRTTDVIRGDEWLSSVPIHLQLFRALGFEPPRYAHIAPIQKMDGNSRRKLSKRYDPEASVTYYEEHGYPYEAITEYMLNMASSAFEEWRAENPREDNRNFVLRFEDFSNSGALLDIDKLKSISRNLVAWFTPEEVYGRALAWSRVYDTELADELSNDPAYALKVFSLERNNTQPRKDIAMWSDIRRELGYFFDTIFNPIEIEAQVCDVTVPHMREAVLDFLAGYRIWADRAEWLTYMRDIAAKYGMAPSVKEYKTSPTSFTGHLGDFAKVLRIFLAGRNQSPDLWEVMLVMGPERVASRLNRISVIMAGV